MPYEKHKALLSDLYSYIYFTKKAILTNVSIAGLDLDYPSSDEIFLISASPVDGKIVYLDLADRSLFHGITGKFKSNQIPICQRWHVDNGTREQG